MNIKELFEKEFYIIECKDFVYYVKTAHIVGIGKYGYEEEEHYILDIKDITGEDKIMSMERLTKYKTLEEAQKEAKRLNDNPSNKKRAKEWNLKFEYMLKKMEEYK